MKWIFTFTFLLYPIAALAVDYCQEPPYIKCKNPLEVGLEDLRTAEDIVTACPNFIDYIGCLGRFDEDCGDKSPRKVFPDIGEFESIRDMVTDICDQNSLLHTALTENLGCISDGFYNNNNNTCYRDKTELYRSLYDISKDFDENHYSMIDRCYSSLYRVTCYLEYVAKNCGALAKEAVIEVFHRSYFIRKVCELEAAHDLAGIIDKVDIRNPLKDILKEVLQKMLKKEK